MCMKKFLLILTFLSANVVVRAQDFHLSMYDAAPLFLNPAMTGVFEGDWRLHAQQRIQWRAVNYKPYNTSLLSFDLPVGKWGFGLQLLNMRAGIGNYNAFNAMASAGYTLPIDANKNHNISFGLQAGITQKSTEYQLYTFDNQYTNINGGGFNNTLPSGETFESRAIVVPQLSAGALYYYARQQSRLNPFFGYSAFNLLMSEETFFGGDNNQKMRHYIHTGTRINITELFYLIPKALLMFQTTAREQTLACDFGYFMRSSEVLLLGGLVYRNKDAAIVSLGARHGNFTGKIGYDINTSSLTTASNGKGGIEFSLTYIQKKPSRKDYKICPRL